MPNYVDVFVLLETVARLTATPPPDLLFIQAGGVDTTDPPELIQFRLHNAWLNSWVLLDEDTRQCLARTAGFVSPTELLEQIARQAISLVLGRLQRTYGDSAKVDGLHRRATQGGQAL